MLLLSKKCYKLAFLRMTSFTQQELDINCKNRLPLVKVANATRIECIEVKTSPGVKSLELRRALEHG